MERAFYINSWTNDPSNSAKASETGLWYCFLDCFLTSLSNRKGGHRVALRSREVPRESWLTAYLSGRAYRSLDLREAGREGSGKHRGKGASRNVEGEVSVMLICSPLPRDFV